MIWYPVAGSRGWHRIKKNISIIQDKIMGRKNLLPKFNSATKTMGQVMLSFPLKNAGCKTSRLPFESRIFSAANFQTSRESTCKIP